MHATKREERIMLTPELAVQFLGTMKRNRPLRIGRARELSEVIKRGKWRYNGEAIKFDTQGRMIDGQHRCKAVIMCGIPIETLVVYGLDSRVFATLDQGTKRTVSDALATIGKPNYKYIAGALSKLSIYLCGGQHDKRKAQDEMLLLLKQHPRIEHSAGFVGNLCRRTDTGTLTCSGALIAAHYIFSGREHDFNNQKKADAIISDFIAGTNLSKDNGTSGFLVVRNKLIKGIRERTQVRGYAAMYMLIKAWNAMLSGHTCKRIEVLPDETPPECITFPRST